MNNTETNTPTLDLSLCKNRELWLHHPVIGDPSFDAFERYPCNPAYTGKPPYEWPVNGSLYKDAKSGHRYCYVSLYPETYWAKDGTVYGPGKTMLLRSKDEGGTWEDLGLIMEGDKDLWDGDGKRGGTTLDCMVVEEDGRYHMLYCWAHISDIRQIGLGYASSDSPEGPFERDPQPMISALKQRIQPGNFSDIYEGTLIRRANDWLILSCIRQNDPNPGAVEYSEYCQALVAMTAPSPDGPWSHPVVQLSPQRPCWLPQPIENGVNWVHEGYVYAPQYSVACNRPYHAILRAPVERAHEPESWEVFTNGSIFHAEPRPTEAMGLWGQSMHGYVDENGRFEIMYPAKDQKNYGTINFAACDWDQRYTDGFWLSGGVAPSLALVQRSFGDFKLKLELKVGALGEGGEWRVVWNHRAVLGPKPEVLANHHADRRLSDETLNDCTSLQVVGDRWTLIDGGTTLAEGALPDAGSLMLEQVGAQVRLNGSEIGEVRQAGGSIGLVAMEYTYLQVHCFEVQGASAPACFRMTALEGMWGSANRMIPEWWRKETEGFLSVPGYSADFEGARAKWSFYGCHASVFLPRGPEYGIVEVWVDDRRVAELDLHAATLTPSEKLWESGDLGVGYHAVMLLRKSGRIPVDQLEYSSVSFNHPVQSSVKE